MEMISILDCSRDTMGLMPTQFLPVAPSVFIPSIMMIWVSRVMRVLAMGQEVYATDVLATVMMHNESKCL